MRKRRMALHVTWHADSQTLEHYVEFENEVGQWELWTEGLSDASRGVSGPCVELQELLMETMAAWSSSTTGTK